MIRFARTEQAHAKINLVLRILAREASGYHGIETMFQRLALHDVVTVNVGDDDRTVTCHGPMMPADGFGAMAQNLAWRAAELYAQEAHWATGWHIVIDKQIPVGGGLGGGSADAAAVLRAMEAMSPAPLGAARVLELAGALGSDVPFLLTQASCAWAWGRGDRLLALPPLPVVPVWLMPCSEGVNTGEAYRAFAAMREASGTLVRAREYSVDAFASWEQIAKIVENDFERVIPALHAGVSETLAHVKGLAKALNEKAGTAIGMLSGSGATCFLLMSGAEDDFGFGSKRGIKTHTL